MYLKRRSFFRSTMRSRNAHSTSSIRFSERVARVASCSGVSMMTSCAPMPFILSNIPSACRLRLPSMPSAGNLLGTTRTVQPSELLEAPFGRYARTSEGVLLSLPGQNGQKPPFIFTGSRLKSVGRLERSVEMMTHRPTMGSLRSSGTDNLEKQPYYLTPEPSSRLRGLTVAAGRRHTRMTWTTAAQARQSLFAADVPTRQPSFQSLRQSNAVPARPDRGTLPE